MPKTWVKKEEPTMKRAQGKRVFVVTEELLALNIVVRLGYCTLFVSNRCQRVCSNDVQNDT